MDISHVKQPLKQFLRALSEQVKVNELIVFGSYVEGRATAESDIDVLVVSDDFAHLNEDERLDLLYDAAWKTEPEVHPWGFTSQELRQASRLTTLGYARDKGIRFLAQSKTV